SSMVKGRTRPEAHASQHRCFLLCILLAMLLAPSVGARPAANPPGRAVLGPEGPRGPTPAAVFRDTPLRAQAVNVPLPAGAVQIDSTYYDLQDMGSLGHRIEIGPDYRVHV